MGAKPSLAIPETPSGLDGLRVVIIGAGYAGLAVARLLDPEMQVGLQ